MRTITLSNLTQPIGIKLLILKLINTNNLYSNGIKNHWKISSPTYLGNQTLYFSFVFPFKAVKNMSTKSCNAGAVPFNASAVHHHYFNEGALLFNLGVLEETWAHYGCVKSRGFNLFLLLFSPIFSLSPFLHATTLFPAFFSLKCL